MAHNYGSRKHQSSDHDIVWGLVEIGKVINRSEQSVYTLYRKGRIDCVHKGPGGYCASRKELVRT